MWPNARRRVWHHSIVQPGDFPLQKKGLSLWSESPQRHGGVAILLNPYSDIQEMTPWLEDAWTPHWMAVSVRIHRETFILFNIYAPSDRRDLERLFVSISSLLDNVTWPELLGGDWNCTLAFSLDRSHHAAQCNRNDSFNLRCMLQTQEWVNALEDEM